MTHEQQKKASSNVDSYFSQCGYHNPKVEVWSQNNIIGFIQVFPSLCLKANGMGHTKFQTHKSWSMSDQMRKDFKAGKKQKDFITKIQNGLNENDDAIHIRVLGEPGIGKTKLVLESTKNGSFSPLVLYSTASSFKDSNLMNEIVREDSSFTSILVIDECNPDSRAYIWNRLKSRGPRIKLITIYNDYEFNTGNTLYLNAPPLEKEQVCEIIQSYGIPAEKADRWAELCSGTPGVAHVLGNNLRCNPEDLLRSPDTVNFWERYITGVNDFESQAVRNRKTVLRHVALFKKFGFGRLYAEEAKIISRIVEKAYPTITWAVFKEIIGELKNRKILQGENTLYITPKALQIKLWTDWWETQGMDFDYKSFVKELSDDLREYFFEMFKYASESEVASRIAKELLGENGPFNNSEYLRTEEGSSFFLALTEADPDEALMYLNRTVGKWDKNRLLDFTTGRRNIIWSLERIAVWRNLFQEAARLLLALGEAENEVWSNNASVVFADLFTPGPGRVAPTEASPEERFPVLKESLESNSKNRRELGLLACDKALESDHFTRAVGLEYQGIRKEPNLWKPKTYEELIDKSFVANRQLLAQVIKILHYDGEKLPEKTKKRWEMIKESLTGSDFSSLLRRYVGLDLWEDKFDEKGNRTDEAQPWIEKLAVQAASQQELLEGELQWLVTEEAKNGYRFGYELGRKDNSFSLLPTLIKKQKDVGEARNVFFLGGYFRALYETDREEWENHLDNIYEDPVLYQFIPELTWRSGLTDRAALRILNLTKEKDIDLWHFRMLGFGIESHRVSESVFKKIIAFLLNSKHHNAISIALEAYDFCYLHKKSGKIDLPKDITFTLLTHEALFGSSKKNQRNQMDDYHWAQIANKFLKGYPDKTIKIAEKIIEHFGEEGSILEGFHSAVKDVLNEITANYPREVWNILIKYMGPPTDSRAFNIRNWLRGSLFEDEKDVLHLIPKEEVFKWVAEDVATRAWYLATFVPKKLSREEGQVCLARELLIRYGEREDVRNNLIANFSTESWSGPASLHFKEKKEWLLKFQKNESDINVRRWIDCYVSILDKEMEDAQTKEERNGLWEH